MNIFKKLRRAWKILNVIKSECSHIVDIPHIQDTKELLRCYDSASLGLPESISLDLGCGLNPKNPFGAAMAFGIDIREGENKNIKPADLSVENIPFPDNHFDYITAHDFLEHIPRVIYSPSLRFPFVVLMNEIWRTLKTGGIFLSKTPVYPYSQLFRDPTHVNFITPETFSLYFDHKNKLAGIYGFRGSFEVLNQSVCGFHLISLLKKTM
jgi:SAM-dependent methyltransferase